MGPEKSGTQKGHVLNAIALVPVAQGRFVMKLRHPRSRIMLPKIGLSEFQLEVDQTPQLENQR